MAFLPLLDPTCSTLSRFIHFFPNEQIPVVSHNFLAPQESPDHFILFRMYVTTVVPAIMSCYFPHSAFAMHSSSLTVNTACNLFIQQGCFPACTLKNIMQIKKSSVFCFCGIQWGHFANLFILTHLYWEAKTFSHFYPRHLLCHV